VSKEKLFRAASVNPATSGGESDREASLELSCTVHLHGRLMGHDLPGVHHPDVPAVAASAAISVDCPRRPREASGEVSGHTETSRRRPVGCIRKPGRLG